MASRAQSLTTLITINAKAGNGFTEVGNTLTTLGSIVDGLSQELISFGRDSLDIYRDYEKSMKDAEVALSTSYGRGTRELGEVMSMLDASATEWAAQTIFHTNDVANAISEAAHAGWDYDQIMSGIPAAMQLAQAGGLDLSEAVNYIVKSTNSAGIEFDNLTHFIDIWAYAANSSASNIGEFGDAMLRMGSTMRFASNPEELMTLIAVTANAGSTGQEAGTLIRNSMLRMIAPTQKADEAMEALGASSEEVAGLLDDEALAAANAELAARGFSAFDEDGNIKDILDVYRELYVALGDIAGGYENIENNEASLSILSAIFPTRTITEALTLIRGAKENYDDLYDSLMNGAAEGYGTYAAETMMDTLDGRIETFGSKVERLKQLVGADLADDASGFLRIAGNFVDSLSEMDSDKFSALVSGLEVVAATGPGLMLAGGAFRLIGTLLSPAGLISAGIVTLGALTGYMDSLSESNLENAFGLADLDHGAIMSGLRDVRADFDAAYAEVNKFRTEVDRSATSYRNASAEFSSKLLTSMVTGTTLSSEDKSSLYDLGSQMSTAVIDGIRNSEAASLSYFEMLFGESAAGNGTYQSIVDVTNSAYEESIAQAEQIGNDLRNALTKAFSDGTISDEEYNNILSYMRSYNDAMSRASSEVQNEQDYVEQQMLLRRAQNASIEEIYAMSAEVADERNRVLSEAEEAYYRERYGLEYRYKNAIAGGTATQEEMDAALAEADRNYNAQRSTLGGRYDDTILRMYDAALSQSEFSNLYDFIGIMSAEVMKGSQSVEESTNALKQTFGGNKYAGDVDLFTDNERTMLSKVIAAEMSALGGTDEVSNRIGFYQSSGDYASAQSLMNLWAMQQINDASGRTVYSPDAWGPMQYVSAVGIDSSNFSNALNDYIDREIEINLTANTDEVDASIDSLDGTEVNTKVTADTSGALAAIRALSGTQVFANVVGRVGSLFKGFADGGRATEASIFGEAGPEWAIPEEHSEHTADLINQARIASGFSWPELMGKYGSGGYTDNSTVIFSPTINTSGASGVDEALKDSEIRFEEWYKERQMMDRAEVF